MQSLFLGLKSERYVRDVEVVGSHPVTPIFLLPKKHETQNGDCKTYAATVFYFKRYVPNVVWHDSPWVMVCYRIPVNGENSGA